ncbi:Allantoicase [Minicystis rosea]|nr:Allantoicase [Minicystis rosea]
MSEFVDLIDLAAERLGGSVLYANDDFFAAKENLLKPKPAVFLEHEYTDRGKWMDGWESRRKRGPGHDFALIRLGMPGILRGVVVDTAFFRGNYPEHCSIEACSARADASPEELMSPATRWVEVLPKSALRGDSKNLFAIDSPHRFTHLRFNIFPDGGVARLRVHGEAMPDWRKLGRNGAEIDVAAVENGGRVPACSDMFFGVRHNLIMPGRAPNMGDGWETKRRRGPGFDWSLIELAAESTLRRIELDTNHFKGNYPDTCMIEGISAAGATVEELSTRTDWREILPRTKLQPHTRHFYDDELLDRGPYTHVRLNIYPDGGVSRLRLFGVLSREGGIARRLDRLRTLLREEAEAELLSCCGSRAWAGGMADLRPFKSLDDVLTAADAVWRGLGPNDWLEAFKAHPRIGEKKAEAAQDARAKAWSEKEQSGVTTAAAETLAALAELNRTYDEKFGHIYIVCATGKSADEMLANLRARLGNDAATELGVAAEQQRKITRIRLEKLFT